MEDTIHQHLGHSLQGPSETTSTTHATTREEDKAEEPPAARVRIKKGEYRPRSTPHPSQRIFVSAYCQPASYPFLIPIPISAITSRTSQSTRCKSKDNRTGALRRKQRFSSWTEWHDQASTASWLTIYHFFQIVGTRRGAQTAATSNRWSCKMESPDGKAIQASRTKTWSRRAIASAEVSAKDWAVQAPHTW